MRGGGLAVGGALGMHSMSSLRLVGHLHVGKSQVHDNKHDGLVIFGVGLGVLQAFIEVNHHVLGWVSNVLANACATLLW